MLEAPRPKAGGSTREYGVTRRRERIPDRLLRGGERPAGCVRVDEDERVGFGAVVEGLERLARRREAGDFGVRIARLEAGVGVGVDVNVDVE